MMLPPTRSLVAASIATTMMWSALLHPVGTEPLGVYWVRRCFVLVAVVLGLLFLGWLWPSGGGHTPARTATRHPTASATTRPIATAPPTTATQPTTAPTGGATCSPQDLAVSADADATDYPKGVEPRITISVKDTAASPCQLDLGSAARFLTISSGPDRVWSSADCAPAAAEVVTLAPGVVQQRTFVWSRHRSLPGCPASANAIDSPPGTYLAQAHVGGVTTLGAVIHLHA